MATKQSVMTTEISVLEVDMGKMDLYIIGTTPLICNRMSEHGLHELLFPKGRKTASDKASSMKHNPIEEFRASPYRLPDDNAPTLIAGLSTWFKRSMCTAALDMPGAKKTQMGRLTFVEGERVPIYGVPQIFCSVTRSADINKTPDVRTRAILPKWCAKVTMSYVRPILREKSVLNLIAAAGMTIGVGDWRGEKGSGNYGSYRLAGPEDKEWKQIVASGGRLAQLEAMQRPVAYDDDTSELLSWFDVEVKRRGFKVAA